MCPPGASRLDEGQGELEEAGGSRTEQEGRQEGLIDGPQDEQNARLIPPLCLGLG